MHVPAPVALRIRNHSRVATLRQPPYQREIAGGSVGQFANWGTNPARLRQTPFLKGI